MVEPKDSTRLLFVDSINRDSNLYPSGNNYVLHLTTPIKNVKSIELLSVRVPNTMYNINIGSNVMIVNGSTNLSLTPGFYSACALSNAVSSSNIGLTLTLNSINGIFTLSSSASFTINITSTEFATLLGMTANTTLTSVNNAIIGSTMTIMNSNEYLFLDIDELKTPRHIDTRAIVGTTGTVSGSNINRAFAPILMNVPSGSIVFYSENSDYIIKVEYPEPIAYLQRLTIRWFNSSGTLLNFRGADNNAFILKATILENDVRDLPPVIPLENTEINRIVDAMTFAPPLPEPKKTKIPWVLIIFLIVLGFILWKNRLHLTQ